MIVGKTFDLATFLSAKSGFSSYTILAALLLSGLWFFAGYPTNGTSSEAGDPNCLCGTVFKLTP